MPNRKNRSIQKNYAKQVRPISGEIEDFNALNDLNNSMDEVQLTETPQMQIIRCPNYHCELNPIEGKYLIRKYININFSK